MSFSGLTRQSRPPGSPLDSRLRGNDTMTLVQVLVEPAQESDELLGLLFGETGEKPVYELVNRRHQLLLSVPPSGCQGNPPAPPIFRVQLGPYQTSLFHPGDEGRQVAFSPENLLGQLGSRCSAILGDASQDAV